jgi:hypothetical protein
MCLHPRRWVLLGTALLLVALQVTAWADRFGTLERATHDSSWRVRLQAAAVLARSKDERAIPILQRLTRDEQVTVRRFAAEALERIRAEQAAAVVTPEPPVSHPHSSGSVHISIGGVGAKVKNAPPELTQRLRELLMREFANTPGLTIDGKPVTGFLIDSSITALNRKVTQEWVEITCEISVVVGRLPSKAMVMMTSGGATVQQPRVGFRNELAPRLEADALEGAVKGAHENLLSYLRKQR